VSVLVGGAILLAIYAATLAPTITWAHYGADGGDLVTAVARGRIPHPPGLPTYLLLGELFIRLPWGDPARRLNLMSAVMAAGAAGLTAETVRRYLRSSVPSLQSPVSTLLCLGLAPLFWSQAIITEVYAPAALFAALVTYLALGRGPAWATGLTWGIGMGVHPTLVLLAPLVAWEACRAGNRSRAESAPPCGRNSSSIGTWRSQGTWGLVQSGLMALLGWGAMYGPGLLARADSPSPWGNVNTLEGWWMLVSGRMYHGYLFALPPSAWPRRILAWVGLLGRQFTPIGAMLAGLGWRELWRERRPLALASALVLGAFSLYAIGYDAADSLVYLVLALPTVALWLGVGLSQAADWLSRRVQWGAWAILLLPLLQAFLFWGQTDLSADRTAMEWAERTLRQAPSQAVILTDRDGHTFTLWYAQDVLGQRSDVAVVDVALWAQEPYRVMMADALGLGTTGRDLSPEDAARRMGRPIVRIDQNDG
jgi:hypothetical protein